MATGFDYKKSQRTADKLIVKFGGKMKGKITREVDDGGTPTRPLKREVVIPCSCVAVDYNIKERQALNIEEGAKRIMISPIGLPDPFELLITDVVTTADGENYTIVPPINELKPTITVVFYDVQGVR